MIVIAAALFGAVWGGMLARKRKGNKADIAQYAVVYALAYGLLGFIVTIIIEKAIT
ncbi:apolipoprotein acyltransferase [Cognatishimia sp. F0-27]|uniref:apolipoprotein acyltransferase n=1 Tax=Cognatishimia sp. F0-27 TaxID=2816855 RepID=UPI001D0CB5B3|nr:apolipoprotein acyltransferase [Cognatishimia sp. F0-27]MCC1492336.1 apolipoprotein acyltransferase [Cognatishimia sp. F0-27]